MPSRDLSETQEEIRQVYIREETKVNGRGEWEMGMGRDKISMSQNV